MTPKEEAKIDALLRSLWKRNLPILYERLDTLDRVAAAAASDDLSEANREEALDIAHKLSGSLGMFGYQQGTEIARQIEQILQSPAPPASDSLTTLATTLRQTLTSK